MTYAESLELAIEETLAEKDVHRVEQVQRKLLEESREEVGRFCCYHRQVENLGLPPWAEPPCWSDGKGNDVGARLYRKLVKAGISNWHPNPLAALQAA